MTLCCDCKVPDFIKILKFHHRDEVTQNITIPNYEPTYQARESKKYCINFMCWYHFYWSSSPSCHSHRLHSFFLWRKNSNLMTLSSRENQVVRILSSILCLIMQEVCQIIAGDTNLLRQAFSGFLFSQECRLALKWWKKFL